LSYRKGRQAEYKCKSELRKLGVALITRSAGSKGLADLVAFFPLRREIWLIQVKSWKNPPSMKRLMKEYGDLIELTGEYKVKAYVYVKRHNRYVFEELRRGFLFGDIQEI